MENKLTIELKGLSGVIFTIDESKKIISDINTLRDIRFTIGNYIDQLEIFQYYQKRYFDYEDRIDNILLEQERDFDENNNSFEVGFNMTDIIDNIKSNDIISDIVKIEFSKIFPNNTLSFEPETEYCYVYTKDKNDAKQFLLFSYNTYIKPFIDNLLKE